MVRRSLFEGFPVCCSKNPGHRDASRYQLTATSVRAEPESGAQRSSWALTRLTGEGERRLAAALRELEEERERLST